VPYQGKYIVINDSLKTLSLDSTQLIYPIRDILSIDKDIPLEDWLKIYIQPNQAIILNESYTRHTKSNNFWLTNELNSIKQIGHYNPMLGTISLLTTSSLVSKKANWYFIYYLLMIILITTLLTKIRQGYLFKNILDEENNGYLLAMSWLISALLTTPIIILVAASSAQYEKMASLEAAVINTFGWIIIYLVLLMINWIIYAMWQEIILPKEGVSYSKYAFFRLLGFIPLTLLFIMIAANSLWAAIPAILMASLVWLIIFYFNRLKANFK